MVAAHPKNLNLTAIARTEQEVTLRWRRQDADSSVASVTVYWCKADRRSQECEVCATKAKNSDLVLKERENYIINMHTWLSAQLCVRFCHFIKGEIYQGKKLFCSFHFQEIYI